MSIVLPKAHKSSSIIVEIHYQRTVSRGRRHEAIRCGFEYFRCSACVARTRIAFDIHFKMIERWRKAKQPTFGRTNKWEFQFRHRFTGKSSIILMCDVIP